jgi:hypothetical protein
MDAREFDKKFDDGVEDIIDDLDLTKITHPNRDVRRVNVDFPLWMVESLDREAQRLGVPRQSVIKTWIADRLEQRAKAHGATENAAADGS